MFGNNQVSHLFKYIKGSLGGIVIDCHINHSLVDLYIVSRVCLGTVSLWFVRGKLENFQKTEIGCFQFSKGQYVQEDGYQVVVLELEQKEDVSSKMKCFASVAPKFVWDSNPPKNKHITSSSSVPFFFFLVEGKLPKITIANETNE